MPNLIPATDLFNLRNAVVDRSATATPAPAAQIINDFTDYKGSYIGGLTYPLTLDSRGGLATSFNGDRVQQQIMEVLETKIGERVWRQFFGIPDVLFDSISEDVLANLIRRQLRESLPDIAAIDFDVNIRATEDGSMYVVVSYDIQGTSQPQTLYYSISL